MRGRFNKKLLKYNKKNIRGVENDVKICIEKLQINKKIDSMISKWVNGAILHQ